MSDRTALEVATEAANDVMLAYTCTPESVAAAVLAALGVDPDAPMPAPNNYAYSAEDVEMLLADQRKRDAAIARSQLGQSGMRVWGEDVACLIEADDE